MVVLREAVLRIVTGSYAKAVRNIALRQLLVFLQVVCFLRVTASSCPPRSKLIGSDQQVIGLVQVIVGGLEVGLMGNRLIVQHNCVPWPSQSGGNAHPVHLYHVFCLWAGHTRFDVHLSIDPSSCSFFKEATIVVPGGLAWGPRLVHLWRLRDVFVSSDEKPAFGWREHRHRLGTRPS